MQDDLEANRADLDIQILGVNEQGHEVGNPPMTDGRDLPWLQDLDSDGNGLSDVWFDRWGVTFRDVIIVDANNVEVGRYNVTSNSLADSENYNALRQMLVDAAEAAAAGNARLNASLVVDPTTTEANGEVAALPDDVAMIHEWQPFALEVWVSTPDSDSAGVTSASAVIEYESDYFSAHPTIEFGPAFTQEQTSNVDDASGRVTVAASTTATDVGDDRHVLLARIAFEATDDDPGVPLADGSDRLAPVDGTWISLADTDAVAVDLAGVGAVDVELGPAPETDLFELMYDLNDDGKIGFGDLPTFAGLFLANVTDQPQAIRCDFDGSGTVSFGDLNYLASNFLKNRGNGDSIVLAENFPEDFVAAQQASAQAAAGRQSAALSSDQLAPIVSEAKTRLAPMIGGDANGFGWFVDSKPADDLELAMRTGADELSASIDSAAAGRVDLLTVAHEQGQALGTGHGARRLTDGYRLSDDPATADPHEVADVRSVDEFFSSLGR